MKPFVKYAQVAAVLLLLYPLVPTNEPVKRPRIQGIAFVEISVSDLNKSRDFYSLAFTSAVSAVSNEPCGWCEAGPGAPMGQVLLRKLDDPHSTDLMAAIAFRTDNVRALHDFLKQNKVAVDRPTKCGGDPCLSVQDPEHHQLVFVQGPGVAVTGVWTGLPDQYFSSRLAAPIIHAGIVVHDRAAEDHFYKDILGFHLYWHGGMKADRDDWVAMQVPDGVDWIEYMLNIAPDASHHTLGVMNHIAVGVPDIHAVQKRLIANGWTPKEEPKVGRDGKWQLNVYDPDDTRIEFMEFTPKEKPCCSDFTGKHPGQQN
jgi:catechol 2,3-dioxygenase-like lactoylglutathione lyase family enzyme